MLRPSSPRHAARRLEALAEISSADVLDVAICIEGVAPDELRGLLACHEHVICGRAIDLALRRPPASARTTCLLADTPVPARLAHLDLAALPAEWTLRVGEGALAAHPWTLRPTRALAADARAQIEAGAPVYLPREGRLMARRETLLPREAVNVY